MNRIASALSRLGIVPAFCLAAGLGVLFAASHAGFALEYRDRGFCWDADVGESVLHGLNENADISPWWQMPSGSTLNALLCNHAPPWASIAALFLLAALYPVLVFALGAQLHSPAAGVLAAAAAAGLLWVLPDETIALQYGLVATAVAVVAVWRTDKPDAARTAALAAAVGVSVLVRSPLFLFPVLLLAFERLSGPRDARPSWGQVAFCAAVVLVFVVPWALAGKAMAGRLNPFEWDWVRPTHADFPIVAGYDTRLEGFAPATGPDGFRSAYAWAAAQLFAHPLAFLGAVLRRCAAAAGLRPFLYAAAAAALWVRRRDAGFRVVGAFALYLLVVENLIQIRVIHCVAAWPPLIALACAGGVELLGARPLRPRPAAPLLLAGSVLVPFALLAFVSGAALLRYQDRGRRVDPSPLVRALERHPDDPYLRTLRGREFLRSNRPADAAREFAAALRLQPSKRRELDYAVTLAVQGGPAGRLVDSIRLDRLPSALADHWERVAALKMLASLFHGDIPAARNAAAAGGLLTLLPVTEDSERVQLFPMLRTCGTLPEYWAPAQRLQILEHIASVQKPDPEFLLYMEETAKKAGRSDMARRYSAGPP